MTFNLVDNAFVKNMVNTLDILLLQKTGFTFH